MAFISFVSFKSLIAPRITICLTYITVHVEIQGCNENRKYQYPKVSSLRGNSSADILSMTISCFPLRLVTGELIDMLVEHTKELVSMMSMRVTHEEYILKQNLIKRLKYEINARMAIDKRSDPAIPVAKEGVFTIGSFLIAAVPVPITERQTAFIILLDYINLINRICKYTVIAIS